MVVAVEGQSQLVDRLRDAELVISGTLTGIESVDRDSPGPITHHEPLWLALKIHIDSVLKGSAPGDTVIAEVPRSADPRVDSGLRAEVGQAGVWVLHRGSQGLTMTEPLDFRSFEEANEVSRLLSQ
jgi:hypothetical protein